MRCSVVRQLTGDGLGDGLGLGLGTSGLGLGLGLGTAGLGLGTTGAHTVMLGAAAAGTEQQ